MYNKLNIEMDDAVKILNPLGEFNCQSFPIIEGKSYEITQEELDKLGKHELKWLVEETENEGIFNVSLIENDPTEENNKINAELRIVELKELLANSDYKAIKFAEGELSEEEYAPTREQRKQYRQEINELEKLIV